MPNNKFNSSRRLGKEEANVLQYFPIKKFRFNTKNHPVIKSSQSCTSSIAAPLSKQEQQMIEGLSSYLECSQREAVRIAFYELTNVVDSAISKYQSHARAGSSEKGHQKRGRAQRFQLTKDEKTAFQSIEWYSGIKSTELLRLSIIYLSKGIRDGTITRLTHSSMKSQIDLFRQWCKTHDGSSTKLLKLRQASELAWQEVGIDYDERMKWFEEKNKLRRVFKTENPCSTEQEFELWLEENLNPVRREIQRMIDEEGIDECEQAIQSLILGWGLSRADALSIVDSNQEEQELSEQEMKEVMEWVDEVRETTNYFIVMERLMMNMNSDLTGLPADLLLIEYEKASQKLLDEDKQRRAVEKQARENRSRKLRVSRPVHPRDLLEDSELIVDCKVSYIINMFFGRFSEKPVIDYNNQCTPLPT